MKIGGKNGLTKNQFRTLILNLQEVAHEIKAEKEKAEKENRFDVNEIMEEVKGVNYGN